MPEISQRLGQFRFDSMKQFWGKWGQIWMLITCQAEVTSKPERDCGCAVRQIAPAAVGILRDTSAAYHSTLNNHRI